MKISSQKPHFFKPILPGFTNGLKIPESFSKYILGPAKRYPDEALLKKKGKEWRVNVVNEHFVGYGWSRFAEENNLEPGDFVVLQHLGNMAFDVIIFEGITQCKKEHVTRGERRPSKKSRFEEVKNVTPSDHGEREEVPDHFIATIHQSNWPNYLSVPRVFARTNGLMGRKCEINVKDEQERPWYFDLSTSADGHIRIRRGSTLAEFFTANGFKKGDSYKFEVVVAGNGVETPVVRILPLIKTKKKVDNGRDKGKGVELIDISESESENNGHAAYSTTSAIQTMKKTNRQDKGKGVEVIDISESESESNDNFPYFTCTIKRSSGAKGFLNIPLHFARLNGLRGKREMILMDNGGRRWRVILRSDHSHFRITGGWAKFRDENGIKEGDAFRFEIVKNGAVPVARLTVM